MLTLKLFNIIFLTGILTSLSPFSASATNNNAKDTQTIIYLLDHITIDYSIGVKEGIVLNEIEYAEMQEFSEIVYKLTDKMALPTNEKTLLLSHILNLQKLIQNKETFAEIDSVIKFLKKDIIKATGFKATLAAEVTTHSGQKIDSEKGDSSDYHFKIASNYLINALKNYKEGNKEAARQDALAAYLEGIEPLEATLKSYAPAISSKLEQQMMQVRRSIEQNKNNIEVEKEINRALSLIVDAEQIKENNSLSYWLIFVLSASILLREGLEAFLIIVLILALLRTSQVKKAKRWIHGGWIAAVAMGIAGWFFAGWIINISGQHRENMEGIITLFAVITLTYVGFWLHNNSHAEKWKTFVEDKIGKQLQKEKMYGLAFFSFMIVFREAFESILFLQAINLETISENKSAIGFGALTAFGLIAIFGFLFLKYSKKIPVRQLFLYSSWGISLLAIILMGKGIHSFQESGWISITNIPIIVRVDWLGIYPSIESIVSQMLLIVAVFTLNFSSSLKRAIHSN